VWLPKEKNTQSHHMDLQRLNWRVVWLNKLGKRGACQFGVGGRRLLMV
jgi:hypothetical protein